MTSNTNTEKSPVQNVAKHKNWKSYFWEFFMLFLAVTLGFFVENIREQRSETHRENEFAKALYTELLDDSIVVDNKIKIRLEKENDMDYLKSYFKDSSLTILPRKFYPAFARGMYLMNTYAFEPKDGILSQLKNSSSIQYFKSIALQKLLGEISVYINNVRIRNDQEYQYFANPIKPFILKHLDFDWVDQLRKRDPNETTLQIINMYLQSNDNLDGKVLNISAFDRTEASNMVSFFKQMMVSTRTAQLNNYIITNHRILQALRENYSVQ